MNIRKSVPGDLPRMEEIYTLARGFMREHHNPTQWSGGYPQSDLLEKDIAMGNSYVCEDEGHIVATFYFAIENDPTYNVIKEGKWLSEEPYGVIHRIASVKKGAGTFCINYCFERCKNLRIDTHKDNYVMQNMLIKNGFFRCGIIFLESGDPRIAFQKI